MRASRGGLALRRIGGGRTGDGRLCGGGSICSCRSRGGVLGKRTWRSRRIDNPSLGAAGGFRRNGGKRCFLALGGGRFFTRLCGRRRWFCRQGGCARRSRRSCDRQDCDWRSRLGCDCRGGHCRRPVMSQSHIRGALASRFRGRGRACRARGVRRRARCRRRRGLRRGRRQDGNDSHAGLLAATGAHFKSSVLELGHLAVQSGHALLQSIQTLIGFAQGLLVGRFFTFHMAQLRC